jgi:hypothetical protein
VLGWIVVRVGGRPEDVLRETLVHELLHACMAVSRADQYLDTKPKFGVEEYVCNTQAPMLVALFRDNPKIRKYLFEEV